MVSPLFLFLFFSFFLSSFSVHPASPASLNIIYRFNLAAGCKWIADEFIASSKLKEKPEWPPLCIELRMCAASDSPRRDNISLHCGE